MGGRGAESGSITDPAGVFVPESGDAGGGGCGGAVGGAEGGVGGGWAGGCGEGVGGRWGLRGLHDRELEMRLGHITWGLWSGRFEDEGNVGLAEVRGWNWAMHASARICKMAMVCQMRPTNRYQAHGIVA